MSNAQEGVISMRRSLTLLGLTADPGAKVWGKVDLVGDADGIYPQAPLGIVNGISDGPTAWLLAGIHGVEVVAIAAAQRIFRDLDPSRLAGAGVCLIVTNPTAFTAWKRGAPGGGGD